jgi:hypothetical protein
MSSPIGRAWMLLGIGVVAAIAAVFGPAEPWGGVDIGAAGAAVFMLTLGAAIWLFASASDRIFPEHMSIAERRAWVGLVFLTLVLAGFMREMWMLSGHAQIPEHLDELFPRRFIERYPFIVIVWGVIAHLVGRRDGGVEADERDLRLRHRADRAGDWALTLIVVGSIVVLASVPQASLSWWLAPVVLANVLFGFLIAKAMVEHLVLAHAYRSAHA